MRLLFSITLVLAAFSCKTVPTVPSDLNSKTNEAMISELICRTTIQDHKIIQLHATLTEAKNTTAPSQMIISWKVMSISGGTFQSGQYIPNEEERGERQASFSIENHKVQLNFTSAPSIESSGTSTPCTVLWTQVQTSSGLKTLAACNAVGTPAQGWYVNGQLLKHSRSCNTEVLACGNAPNQEGWFVQKKVDRVRIADERCAWRKDKPVCKTKDGFSAWYLDERLVARDDECHQKSIECGSTPSKGEGWIAFKRSEPQLFTIGSCNPLNANTSQKTVKNRATKNDSSRDQVE